MKINLPYATELPLSRAVPVVSTHDKECLRVIHTDELIFTATVITPMLILKLPMTFINGRPVPTVIFDGQQSTFQAFLFCIVLACYGSVYSILLREKKPKVAGIFHTFAVVSMVVSIAIFLLAAACSVLKSWLPVLGGIVA